MGYKKIDRCLEKAYDDEPIFVLMARDPQAPYCIMQWIALSQDSQPPEKLQEAFEHSLRMVKARADILRRINIDEQIKELEGSKHLKEHRGPEPDLMGEKEDYPVQGKASKPKIHGKATMSMPDLYSVTTSSLIKLGELIRERPHLSIERVVLDFIEDL